MLAKALLVVKSKAALAILGLLVVGGGGGAVALAASQGHLNGLGIQMAASKEQSTNHASSNSQGHAEGMLTACDATAGTITVTDAQGKATNFTVDAKTTFNGDIHGNNSGGSTSASNPTFALKDLCALVNTVKVQVQSTASTSGGATTYTATKVTVEGPGTGGAGAGNGNGAGAGKPTTVPGGGKPTTVPTPNSHSKGGN